MSAENPFPGLRPFLPTERHLFMGREVAFEQVAAQTRVFPLTVMFARSGIGKSSFLTCRLIPSLTDTSDVTYMNEWGSAPPDVLVNKWLAHLASQPTERLEKPLLVLDQFEDVFKLSFDREPLWEQLAEATNVDDPPVHVLVSMREEWLGAWAEAEEYLPGALRAIVRLLPLTDDEARRAIVDPPKNQGNISLADDFVETIIAELKRSSPYGIASEYVEAGMLQLVCHRLWQEAHSRDIGTIDLQLYESLGRANTIAREFVWEELGQASTAASRFDASDRVLWFGAVRYLVVAQGIKSIVTAEALGRLMRVEDLGFAGPATIRKRLTRTDERYLTTLPERRGAPPEGLTLWIAETLTKGVEIGFLKRQQGRRHGDNLFELSHDSLGDMFQQLSIDFEKWLQTRFAILVGIFTFVVVLLPLAIIFAVTEGLATAIVFLGASLFFGLVYLIVVFMLIKIVEFIWGLVAFPIIRRLSKGVVPFRSSAGCRRGSVRQ